MIKGSFVILLFYFLGELISSLLSEFIPGSVIGMILLFLALLFKIVPPDWVKNTATVITNNMAVFFVPAAVGLIAYMELLSDSLFTVFTAIAVSTVLTIVVVALVQESFEKRSIKRKEK